MELPDLDEAALGDLAARVAEAAEPGDVVVLAGEVGAGKTTFVRAAAHSLGVRKRVTSPTYQLARGYAGRDGLLVNHLDLYRVEDLETRDVLELDDYLDPRAVTFIEWAEPALGFLEDPTVVRLHHQAPDKRRASISGPIARRL